MTDFLDMSGAQRAASFLLSLDKEAAGNVFKHIDEKVIVEVVEAMGRLEASMTDPETVRALEKELFKSLRKPRGARIRSDEELHAMLAQTLGKEQAGSLFEKIQQRLLHERPFISIEKEPAANIAQVLMQESDAVAALVLAHLDPSLSAEVLSGLPPERALLLVKRMAALVPPGFDTLVAIAQNLNARLKALSGAPVSADTASQLKTIAEVLNYSKPEIEKTVLDGIQKDDAKMAADIREFMFTWEDLAGLDKRAMQKILASIDTRTLSISLKACSVKVEENIMNNLSTRVRDMVKDERDLAGTMPMKDVQNARGEVMKAVRSLMEAGEFRPARAGEELVA